MADKFEHLDPNDERDEGEDEEEEEEEEEGEDPRDARASATPATALPAAARSSRARRQTGVGQGSSHRGQEVRKRGRVPGDATSPTQANLLWLDILQRKEIVSRGILADHFSIQVSRLEGSEATYLTSIDGGRCAGDGSEGSAGEALMHILISEIHWNNSKGLPAIYKLTFTFKRGGTIYDSGKIRLPSTEELGRMRAAQQGLGGQPPQGYSPPGHPPPYGQQPQYGPQGYGPQGFGAPPPQYPPQYGQPPYGFPPYGYPPPGFGAPPPMPPAPNTGDEVADLREQVRSLSEMMRDMWRFGPGGQQGYGQPGYGQPQGFGGQPQPLPMSAFGEMQQHLSRFGLTIAPVQQPGAAMVPTQPQGFHAGLGQLKELAQGVVALKEVADALNGVFNQNASAMVAEEPKPEPDFEMVEVPGSKWPDGSPVQYARDDKGINGFGTIMGNAFAMQKFGTTLAGIGKKIASQIGKEQGVGALADEEEEEEEEEEKPQPPQPPQQQQQRAVVTPPPQNPPPPRMNGATRYDDGFSL